MKRITKETHFDLKEKRIYTKINPTYAIQMFEEFEVETLEGIVRGKIGDYLLWDMDENPYMCDKEIFEKTYKKITDPWRD